MADLLLSNPILPELDQRVAAMALLPRLNSFGDLQVNFIDQVSESLMGDPALRQYPELAALAFWMRAAHLLNLKKQFLQRYPAEALTKPRGLVLHFAPANVDTIFVYSWFLSLLMGNANVVRLSTRRNPQTSILLDKLAAVLSESQFAPIAQRSLVLSYDHDPQLTVSLSSHCDLRVIWGGDETIRAIRQAPLKPTATDMVFADRFSLALFKAQSILDASEEAWERLVRNFYNDVFWFNQMACSSPRLLLWIGPEKVRASAQQLFWTRFEAWLDKQSQAEGQTPNSSLFLQACLFAARQEVASVEIKGNQPPVRVQIGKINPELRALHGGGGVFLESGFDSVLQAASDLLAKDQTVVQFGFSPQEIRAFADTIQSGAVDRVVPVGQALQFSAIWDGYDLLQQFSRQVLLC